MEINQIPEMFKFAATLGVGGVLAGLIFWFYRKDSIAHADAWQGQSEALLQVVKDNTAAMTALQQTISALRLTTEALRNDMTDRDRMDRMDRGDRR